MPDPMNTIQLATELAVAWLSNPNTRVSASDDVHAFLHTVKASLDGLNTGKAPAAAEEPVTYQPAVSVRRSLASPDFIISMIDGKSYKTLRRHLSTNGLTPAQYIERYNLKNDYPMVAQSYSDSRRAMAKQIGLGRKPKAPEAPAKAPAKKPAAKKPVSEATEG